MTISSKPIPNCSTMTASLAAVANEGIENKRIPSIKSATCFLAIHRPNGMSISYLVIPVCYLHRQEHNAEADTCAKTEGL